MRCAYPAYANSLALLLIQADSMQAGEGQAGEGQAGEGQVG